MRKITALLFSLFALSAVGQNACPTGSSSTSTNAIIALGCMPVSQPVGSSIVLTGQTAAMSAQILCDVAANNGGVDPCPAGLYYVFVSAETVTAGTLLSAMTVNLNYTTDVRSYTQNIVNNYSLLSLTTAGNGFAFFKKSANTPITLTGTFIQGTGSPSYNLYARIIRVATN